MDYTLLRAFLTVAREGNLTRAAAQLHLTQPAVSLQIKNLQEMLGVVLFSRTSHGLLLTRDGEALLPHAERALAAASDVQRAAATLRHEVSGTLRIGTILDPEFLRLGGFLRQLVETYPRIETAMRHGMSGWVLERVKSRDFDVGYFIGDPTMDGTRDGERFHVVRLTPFIYRVLAPAGWNNRVNKGKRSWAALAKLPWIWTPPESAHNRLLSRIFRDAHAHALTIVEGVTVPTQLSFITLAERREEPAIAAALKLIEAQWAV
ncbi:Transcriptional regulator [Candidatus Burkholderia verschuerenii]|uniref:Transcriptional regulator n=1 Tax=Candidatus Burkholderia verschuerenii TaxID=242163 RepID=A0A0L0MGR4_9BURK|nr:LysR family transcriptional regulator [Candidatus Burkholderia verschuerenii]KND61491.1 Transcriptional regulator [Candidatus Burkholderia verschuerenii]